MKVFVVVSYKGTNYDGWAKQPNRVTIQGEIEKSLSRLYDEEIHVYASGRTDKGVHALGQTFHYETTKKKPLKNVKNSLNLMLNDDIKIFSMKYVSDDFHARYNATSKEYVYKFKMEKRDPFLSEFVYLCSYNLDLKLMKEGMKLFEGTHNFQNFTSKEKDEDNFKRTIYAIRIKKEDDIYIMTFNGDGFMRYMVRYLVGTLIEVGRGRIPLSFICDRLNSNQEERNIVSYKAPSHGLYLKKVNY